MKLDPSHPCGGSFILQVRRAQINATIIFHFPLTASLISPKSTAAAIDLSAHWSAAPTATNATAKSTIWDETGLSVPPAKQLGSVHIANGLRFMLAAG